MPRKSKSIDWAAVRARLARAAEAAEQRDEAEVIAQRTARYQAPLLEERDQGSEVVLFARCGIRYGMLLSDLQEIRNNTRIALMPGLPPVLKGVIHVRGQVLAVHDLAALDGPAAPLPEQVWLLLGARDGVALLADEVNEIVHVHLDALHPVPLHLAQLQPAFLGVDDDGTLLISLARLVSNPTFFNAQRRR